VNKKGMLAGIIALLIVVFMVAISFLVSLQFWIEIEEVMLNTTDSAISQSAKDNIELIRPAVFGPFDYFFAFLLVALLISYIVTSVTLPTDRPVFLIIFLGFLVIITIIAMFLSNGWAYIAEHPNFVDAIDELSITDWFMRYLPYVVFFTGISGAVLFYSRKSQDFTGGGDKFGVE